MRAINSVFWTEPSITLKFLTFTFHRSNVVDILYFAFHRELGLRLYLIIIVQS